MDRVIRMDAPIEKLLLRHRKQLSERDHEANKGTYGRLTLVAGSRGMAGAAFLSGLAAFRCGIGMVKYLGPECNRVILQELIPLLKEAGGPGKDPLYKNLAESMDLYREKQLQAFLKDLGERSFPKRMYFGDQVFGEENMYLEPMGFTLQIRELPETFKRKMYEEMRRRVYTNEKIGARQQQDPEFEVRGFIEKGTNTNGGIWWALNGPVVAGVGTFDRAEAEKLLRKMTWASYQESYPEYWSSYWSAADSFNSSLVPSEGLPGFRMQPVFCAHPHAWVLYCYQKLKEMK